MLDRFDPRWDDTRTREPEGLDLDGRSRYEDIEVTTVHYRGAHAAAAARSGFSRYRSGSACLSARGGTGRGRGGGRGGRGLAEELLL
jgi:hypothetical protein